MENKKEFLYVNVQYVLTVVFFKIYYSARARAPFALFVPFAHILFCML